MALADELHFWKTSEKVNLSQSSLSRQIQALEDELGVKLLERDKRNVKLTEAGVYLKEEWTRLLDELDRTHQQAKRIDGGTSGSVSIAYPGSIANNYLPELLTRFSQSMPQVRVELLEPADEYHEEMLLNYKIDISFSRDAISNLSINSKPLYSEPVCLVVPHNHWLQANNFKSIKALQHERFIVSPLHHKTFFASLIRQLFMDEQMEPAVYIASDFGGMILNLVSKGLGISILPMSYEVAGKGLVRFIPMDKTVSLYINWRKENPGKVVQNIVDESVELAQLFYVDRKI